MGAAFVFVEVVLIYFLKSLLHCTQGKKEINSNNVLFLEQKYIIFFNAATYSLFFCGVDNILHSRHTIKGGFYVFL